MISGADGVIAAVDMDHLTGGLREPVAQQGDTGPRDRIGIVDVPAERAATVPGVLEEREPGDRLGGHRPDRTRSDQIAADLTRSEFLGEIARDALQRGLRDPHPVVRGPGLTVVEVESDDRPAVGHERHEGVGEGLERVGGDVHRGGDVLPWRTEEVVTEAGGRGESDGMEHTVHPAERRGDMLAHLVDVFGDRHVELEHRRHGFELARSSLGQRHRASGAGQHDLGAFGDGQSGHAVGE